MAVKRQVYTIGTTTVALNIDALGFSPSAMFLSVENADLRVSYDGSSPTPTDGHRLYDSQTFTISKPAHIRNFKMCTVTGIAKVNVTLESA